MLLKGELGGCVINCHGNYIVDHGKSWKNHGIVILNFCGNHILLELIACIRTVSFNIMEHFKCI